jgi:inorganic pyrophosphatase
MDVAKIPIGRAPPHDVNVVVEIPQGGQPVKYELDKSSGAVFVDRFLHTAMFYPGNYGFVPHTLARDDDPIDVLIVGPASVVPGAVVRCRPIGALMMEDEHGPDEKIIAVPVDELHPFYTGVRSYQDLPPILCDQIAHFSVTTKTWRPANGLTSRVGRIPRRPPLSSPPRSLAPRAENWIAQLPVILTASVDRFAASERSDALNVRLSFLDDPFSARGRAGPRSMVRSAARLDAYSRRS